MAWATAAANGIGRFLWHLARIRYRLLLVNVIVAAVPLVGMTFARMHETQLLAGLEQDMINQGHLVRELVRGRPITSPPISPEDRRDGPSLSARSSGLDSGAPLRGAPAADSLATVEAGLNRAAKSTRTRIRILDATGAVVADSHRTGPPEGAEKPVPRLVYGKSPTHAPEVPRPVELATRPEIKAALAGKYGSATRLWDNQDRVYLFAALPMTSATGTVEGVVYVTRSTHDVKMQLFRLRTWLMRLLIATLAVTALLSLVLATTVSRPLARLTKRAQRIAMRQPADATDGLAERSDEIGQLARAVEAMTDELERRARDARTLAADISHEFKTPLAGIRGAAELLRDGAADEPEARDRFLAMILDDAARLDRHVSRLLELARLEDDRGVALPVDVAGIVRDAAARTRAAPIVVEIDPSAGDAVTRGRSVQLAAAIDNLVANAVQHASPDTPVRIGVERVPGAEAGLEMLRISVANVGLALSANAQRKVWDRFYSTRTASGGSGLGLAIVRSVALAHGGGVGVECRDGVTTFWFDVRAA
jgi:two-component system sensor histidine kinase ChvG